MIPAQGSLGMSSWILRRAPRPDARLRLFCLPHAGGDSWIFQDWQSGLPGAIEVCPVRLPGRGSRMDAAPMTDLPALVATLAREMRPLLDRPYAVFGHSMGALIGFELARELRRQRALAPAMLCVAAYPAPQLPLREPRVSELPAELLLRDLDRRFGAGHDLADNPDLLEIMLPVLRADMTLCECYDYADERPLDCPIAAYGGISDPGVTPAALDAWEAQTSQPFLRHAVPGGHFFPVGSRAALLEVMAYDLTWAMS